MTPDLLELMTSVSAPSLHPNGEYAVVATSRPSFATDSYVGQLWLVPTEGEGQPRRLTRGQSDAAPQFSPDGTRIAFLRPDGKNRPQLALLDARGGEPQILTDRHLGVTSFVWSPDGTQIAFVSRTPEQGRYGTIAGVGAGLEDPRLITEHGSRANGLGWALDKRSGIFMIDVPDLDAEPYVVPVGRVAQDPTLAPGGHVPEQYPTVFGLTDTSFDAGGPVFSGDGSEVFFTSAQHDGRFDDLRSGIYRVGVSARVEVQKNGEFEAPAAQLVVGSAHGNFSYSRAVISADGATLFALVQDVGTSGIDFVAKNTGVSSVPIANLPVAEANLLTDLEVNDYGDVHSHLVSTPTGSVLAFARSRGRGELHEITAAGVTSVVSSGPRVITGAADAAGKTVITYSDSNSMGEVGLILDGGEVRTLTSYGQALVTGTHVSEQREFTATSPDGYPVHGWIYLPQGEGPHPVILNIHGGPFADYDWAYFDEAQVLTQAGYAVIQCNPRGSAGYGQAHGRSIKEAMGTNDFLDVIAFLEGAIAAEPRIDGTRAGVMGGSYGGFLTAWIIAHDHRFKAAIVERGYLEPLSFVGTSDIGWFFANEYAGYDRDQIEAQSPYAFVDQVQTPTLIIHSEEDLRCPLEQAQRYFVALKATGTPTQMLVFPGENHELSRSGTPWHRKQRFEATLNWWATHLPILD